MPTRPTAIGLLEAKKTATHKPADDETFGNEKQNVVAAGVQLLAPCPQSKANGGPSNMVQGTRAHMEHTGWRHQHQRQDTHTLSADDPTHE